MKHWLESLPARRQQQLALALLVAILLLLCSLTILPALSLYLEQGSEIETLVERLKSFKNVAATREDYERQMQRLKRNTASTDAYLKSSAANVASSELTEIIRRVVKRHQGDVQSTRDIGIVDKGLAKNMTPVAVQVVLRGNVNSLQAILYDLEIQKPYLFIDRTYVRTKPARQSNNPQAIEGELDLQLVVVGYILYPGG